MSKSYTFKTGSIWEGYDWEIEYDYVSQFNTEKPCPHCHSCEIIENKRSDGSIYSKTENWVVPRVAIVLNEGGCNSTGLCIDCLFDALKSIEDNK